MVAPLQIGGGIQIGGAINVGDFPIVNRFSINIADIVSSSSYAGDPNVVPTPS